MNKRHQIVVGLLIMGGLLGFRPGIAATTTTAVEGTLGISGQGCLQLLTATVGDGENCMYNGGPSFAPGATPYGEITGPYLQITYYDSVATPAAFAGGFTPTPGDGKIAQLITGSFTIDDAGTTGSGSDDTISFNLTLRSPGSGDVIRNFGNSGADKYTSMTQVLAPTAVHSATANGDGGFDYVIGSAGFPSLRTFNIVGPCLGQPFGSLDCDFQFDAPGIPDPNGWQGASAAGLGSLEGNTGGRATGTLENPACIDDGGDDCTESHVSFGPRAIGPNNAGGPGGIAAEDPGWDQVYLKVSTDAAGKVTAVAGFDIQDYQVFGPPFACGSDPGATFACNSWLGGYFTLGAAASGDAVDDGPFAAIEGVALPIDVMANDSGFADPVTVTLATNPTQGTAVVTDSPGPAAGIRIHYTASIGASGTDTFNYTVTDGANTDTATVTVSIGAGANNDTAVTTRNRPVAINVGANDGGFGDAVTVTIDSGSFSNGGSAVVTAGNGGPASGIVVTYTPVSAAGSPSYVETFSYTIDDGTLPPATAVVTVNVNNTVPVAPDGTIASISTMGAAPLGLVGSFTAPGTGGSLGNAPAVVAISSQGSKGTATVSGNTITYTISDAAFFTGSDTFEYTITDLDGETDSGTVTVSIANVAPTISAGQRLIADESASGQNRPSPQYSPTIGAGNGALSQQTLAVSSQATNGTCTLTQSDATGKLQYTANAGYVGDDSCALTLTDGDGQTASTTVSITVNPVSEVQPDIGGAGALDLWSLMLLGFAPVLRRRRDSVKSVTRWFAAGCRPGVLCLLTLSLAVPLVSHAAEQLQEIVVTSRKIEENLQTVPLSITAYDSDMIESAGITNLNDVAELTPGLSFFNAFGENLPVPVIRGVVPTDIFGQNSAAVFVDGIYISGREGLNFSQLDIANIEVVKGPQSALYGRNAFSGAVLYSTKRPSEVFEAQANAEVGNRDKIKGSLTMSGPLLGEKLRGRASVLYDDWDGSYDNSLSNNDIGGYRYRSLQGGLLWLPTDNLEFALNYYHSNDSIDEAATVALPMNCEDRIDGNNSVRLQNFCGKIPKIESIPGLNGGDAIPKVSQAVGEERKLDRLSLNINWDLAQFGTITSLSGYSNTEQSSVSDFTRSLGNNQAFLYCDPATAGANYDTPNSCGTSPANLRFFSGIYDPEAGDRNKEFSQELRWASDQDRRMRFLAGAYYYTVTEKSYPGDPVATRPLPTSQFGDAIGLPPFDPSAPNFAIGTAIFATTFLPNGGIDPLKRQIREDETNGWSFFGAVDYDLTDRLTARAEIRVAQERNELTGISYAKCTPPDTAAECGDIVFDLRDPTRDIASGSERFNQTTGRIGLKFQMNEDWMLYGSVANGEKPGGLEQVQATVLPPGQLPQELFITNSFDPETLTAYELGVKGSLFDRRLRLDTAVYYMDWKDIVLRQLRESDPDNGFPLDQPTGFNVNAGDATVIGFEFTGDMAITDFLTGRATVGWVNSELDDAKQDTYETFPSFAPDGDVSGNKLLRQPEWMWSGSLKYERPLQGDWSWYVNGDVSHQGPLYLGNDNESWLPAHTYVNSKLGMRSGRYTLELWARNIFEDKNAVAGFRDIYFANTDNQYAPYVDQGPRPNFDKFVPLRYTITYPRERTFGLNATMRFGGAVK